jgi:hypothetical protein
MSCRWFLVNVPGTSGGSCFGRVGDGSGTWEMDLAHGGWVGRMGNGFIRCDINGWMNV